MEQGKLEVRAQITFLYYDDLEPADEFYREVMQLELVEDQGWVKIYSVKGNAFVGIVCGERGFHQPQEENAVLITLVVDDVFGWYDYLKGKGVKLLTEVREVKDIQIRAFFVEDPGGYSIEIQQFLAPEVARIFHQG